MSMTYATPVRRGALRLALVAAGLSCVALIGAPALAAAAPAAGPELAPAGQCAGDADAAAAPAVQQGAMRCLINAARQAHGLSVLSASAPLARSAALKNALMVRCDDFAHNACGQTWDRVFTQAGFRSPSHGENIGWASAAIGSPRQVMARWLASPEHRANILRPGWSEQAAAVRVDVDFQSLSDVNVWTSQFGAGGLAAAAERGPEAAR
jgi:uncharacterized protein YkwD